MTLAELLSRLEGVRGSGQKWTARCPAHADRSPSLSVGQDGDKLLVHCHTGCTSESVMAALGLSMRDLWLTESYRAPLKARRLPSWAALRQEADILLMCLDAREQNGSAEFRRRYPQMIDPHPEETFARERQAAKRIHRLLETLYGL